MYINDSPIKSAKDDALGRAEFAKSLGREIAEWKDEDSIVIGLYGAWGAGKSSVINIALEEIKSLKKGKKKPIIFYFNPWNYSDQEKLVVTFLQELARSVSYYDPSEDAKKVGKELMAYSKFFVPLAFIPPVTGLSLLFNKLLNSVGEAVSAWGQLKEKPIEEYKKSIARYIKKLDRKIIIVIDDIDRLNRKEIRQVFQLVKQNANFSNVIYILPFDHQKVAEAMDEESYPGKSYIEKIVQIPFSIPQLEIVKLRRVLFNELDRLIKPLPEKDWDDKHWGNVFHDGLKEFFTSLRQVKRFVNSLEFNFSRINNDVNVVDFIALEVIRVFCPKVYEAMARNKSTLTKTESMVIGLDKSSEQAEKQKKVQEIFDSAEPEYKDQTIRVLKRLFPQIDGRSSYGHDWQIEWSKAKRICAEDRFDRYFLLGIPENEVSQAEIDNLVSFAKSSKDVSREFEKLIAGGKAKDFLEKLYLYVDVIPEAEIVSFVVGIYNSIRKLPGERHSDPFNDAYTWCMRLGYNTIRRIADKQKRRDLVIQLIEQTTDLEVVSRFISTEIRRDEDKKADDDKKLLEETDLALVREKLGQRFDLEARSGDLLNSRNLAYMLYLWAFLSDDSTVSEFLKKKMTTLKGIAIVVKGFMWSQSSVTLGDYVGKHTWKVNTDSLKKFVDIEELKNRLVKYGTKRIQKLSIEERQAIVLFLESFENKSDED